MLLCISYEALPRFRTVQCFDSKNNLKKRSKQIINGLSHASRPNICIEHSIFFKEKQQSTCIICDSPLYFWNVPTRYPLVTDNLYI